MKYFTRSFVLTAGLLFLFLNTFAVPPSIDSVKMDSVRCNGESSGNIHIYIKDGVSPYTYFWQRLFPDPNSDFSLPTGATNYTFSGLKAGFYQITVVDDNGDFDQSFISIKQPAALIVGFNLTDPASVCSRVGLQIIATANGGNGSYAHKWYGSGSDSLDNKNIFNPLFTARAGGSFIVTDTVKDYKGCVAFRDNTINVDQSPTSSVLSSTGLTTICPGDNTTLKVTITSGQFPFTVTLSDGSVTSGYISGSNITVTPAFTTTYTISSVVDAKGCSSSGLSGSVVITVNANVSIATQPTTPAAVCEGTGSQTMTVVAGGTAPFTYQWQILIGAVWTNLTNVAPYSGVTTATLTITAPPIGLNGAQYRCSVGGGCGAPVTTNVITLPVNANVSIATQPTTPAAVCEGTGTQTMTVVAGGTAPFTYQWQILIGAVWTNLTNVAPYSGVTTATLTITNPPIGLNNAQYRCSVGGGCGAAVLSNVITISVNTNVSIATQPTTPTAVCEGTGSQTMTVAASGTVPFSYQWQILIGAVWTNLTNVAPYSGVTTATLTITAPPIGLNGAQYRCSVGGGCGTPVTTNVITLPVSANVSIATQPTTPAAVCEGTGSQTMTIVAGGTAPFTYQWQILVGAVWTNLTNVAPYSGVTTATLTITAPPIGLNGAQYRCSVGGGCGAPVTTNVITLPVNANVSIATQPTTPAAVCENTGSQTMTVVAGGTVPFTYQWQILVGAVWTNLTNVAPYSGVTTATLTITAPPIGLNNAQYRCSVGGGCGAAVLSNVITISVNTNVSIATQPTTPTAVCEGTGSQTMTVAASGTVPFSYQWQILIGAVWTNLTNFAPYSGVTTATLTITAPPIGLNGAQYRCSVGGGCGTPVTTNVITLPVSANVSIATQPTTPAAVCEGTGSQTMTVVAGGTVPFTYQWQILVGAVWTNLTNVAPYSGVTTATLTITAPPIGLNGAQYRCSVGGGCGTPVTTNVITLPVNANVSIATQPTTPAAVCENTGSQTMTVVAGGTVPFTYQWQILVGAVWTNLTNVAPYSGVTTATLTITAPPIGLNNAQYRCSVGGGCGAAVLSNVITISVNTNVSIATQPTTPTAVCEGTGSQTMTVAASGTVPFSYQWQILIGAVWTNLTNVAPYSGVTTATLTITAPPIGLNGAQYRCSVGGGCGTPVTTNVITLPVNTNVSIATQPTTPAAVCEGTGSQTMTVVAGGTAPFTYQWQILIGAVWTNLTNVAPYSGVTTATLTITAPPIGLNGAQYRCSVGGGCGAPVTTNVITLPVNANVSIATQPTTPAAVCEGTGTQTMTVVAGGTAPFTYQWQILIGAVWTNLTNVAPYSGVTTATLTITNPPIGLNNAQYRCSVGGGCGAAVLSNVITISVNTNVSIATQPTTPTAVCEGTGSQTMTVAASGTVPFSYQWQILIGAVWTNLTNVAPYSGVTTATLTITAPPIGLNGAQYRCSVGGGCGTPVTTNVITLPVSANVSIATQPTTPAAVCEGTGSQTMTIVAGGTAPFTYQWQILVGAVWTNLTNVAPYSGVTTATLTITAPPIGLNGAQYRCSVGGGCGAPVTTNVITLPVNANVSIATQPTTPAAVCENTGSQTMTVVAGGTVPFTYQWQILVGAVWTNLTNVAPYSGVTTATLTITAPPIGLNNAQYRCSVGGGCGAAVLSNVITISVNTNVSIATQPTTPTAVCEGTGSQTMTVAASGTVPFSYQWQILIGAVWTNLTNFAPYSGVTTATLTITAPPIGLNGAQYRCSVGGGCGTPVTTNVITLPVNTNVSIATQPTTPAAVCEGTGSQTMTVVAGGTVPFTYQWQILVGAVWTNLTNVAPYSGVTTATLTITAPPIGLNGAQYRCSVGGGCGTPVTTNVVTLPVNANVSIATQPTDPAAVCAGTGTPSMTVVAGGTAPFTYQWQILVGAVWTNLTNVAPYSGVTTATLTITNPPIGLNNAQYRCSVGGGCGAAVNSNAATLAVIQITQADAGTDQTGLSMCGLTTTTLGGNTPVGTETGTWSIIIGTGGTVVTPSSPTSQFNGIADSTYILRWTISNALCSPTSDDVTISFWTLPDNSLTVTDTAVCFLQDATITVRNSVLGINYQLRTAGNINYGIPVAGTGGDISFTILASDLVTGLNLYNVLATNGTTGCSVQLTDLANIIKRAPITQTIIHTNVKCNGESNGTITVDANGGGMPYSISFNGLAGPWNKLENVTYTVSADTFHVISRDISGCYSIDTAIIVTQPDPITFTLDTASATCSGTDGHITITAFGGTVPYMYSIYGDDSVEYGSSNDFQGLPADNYFVVVKDANNCKSNIEAISLFAADKMNVGYKVNDPPSEICYGDSGHIILSASGGSGFFEYFMNIIPSEIGTYQLNDTFYLPGRTNFYGFVRDRITGCIVKVDNGNPLSINTNDKININVASIDSVSPCHDSNNGRIRLNPSTGGRGGPYTYWLDTINKGSSRNYPGLASDTFRIRVFDRFLRCHQDTFLFVPAPPPIIIDSITTVDLKCTDDKIGEIHIVAHGGLGTLRYSINGSPLSTNPDTTGLDGGIYNIEIKDWKGCPFDTTIIIKEPLPLAISRVDTTPITCFGITDGTIDITMTGGTKPYKFTLYPGGVTTNNTGLFDSLAKGKYVVEITDKYNCDTLRTDSLEIREPGLLVLDSITHTDLKCFGDSTAQITVIAHGGTGPLTYTLTPGPYVNQIGIFNNLPANNYNLRLTDKNNCLIINAPVNVIQPSKIIFSSFIDSSLTCFQSNDGVINTVATGGIGTLTYQLNALPVQPTGYFDSLSIGTYAIHVRDSNNCKLDTSVTLVQPGKITILSAVANDETCIGWGDGSVNVDATGGTWPRTYTIKPNVQLPQDTGVFNSIPAGTFTVVVTDVRGCPPDSTVPLTVGSPQALVISIDSTNINCSGDSTGSITIHTTGGHAPFQYSINGVGPGTYSWSPVFDGLGSGSYDIWVKDTCGSHHFRTVTIVESSPITVTLDITNVTGCHGDTTGQIVVHASGGSGLFQYSIDIKPLQNNDTFPNLGAKNSYSIAIIDSAGCRIDTTAIITEPDSLIIVSVDTTGVNGATKGTADINVIGGTGIYHYWIDSGPVQDNNPHFANLDTGFYMAHVRDDGGCEDSMRFQIKETHVVNLEIIVKTRPACPGSDNGEIILINVNGNYPIKGTIGDGINTAPITLNTQFDTISGRKAGTYFIFAKDFIGRTFYDTVVISVDSIKINLLSLVNPGCGLDSGSIDIDATGNYPPFTYLWTSEATSDSIGNAHIIGNLVVGLYDVTVRDSFCSASASFGIIERKIELLSIDVNPSDCNIGLHNGSINVILNGTEPYHFSWQPDSLLLPDSPFITDLAPGTYDFSVVDDLGCSLDGSAIVDYTVSLGMKRDTVLNETCLDSGMVKLELTSNIPPMTLNWIFKDSLVTVHLDSTIVDSITVYKDTLVYYTESTTINSSTLYNRKLLRGHYGVYLSDDFKCRTNLDTFKVDTLNWLHINAGRDTSICRNDSFVMQSTAWLGKRMIPGDSIQFNSIKVSWTPKINFVNDTLLNAVTKKQPPYMYLNDSYDYTLTATSGINCRVSDDIELKYYPYNGVKLPSSQLVSRDRHEIVPIIGGIGSYDSYAWTPSLFTIENSVEERNLVVKFTGDSLWYYFTGTTMDGCKETDSVHLFAAPAVQPSGGLTPNGDFRNDTWYIKNAEYYTANELTIEIFNRWGQKLFMMRGYDNASKVWDGTYNGKPLPIGTYYYVITVKNGNAVKGTVTILKTKK